MKKYPDTVEIQVTQQHIDRAEKYRGKPGRFRTESCPIALAAKDVFHTRNVSAHQTMVVVRGFANYSLPARAQSAISRFDSLQTVKPLVFKARRRP